MEIGVLGSGDVGRRLAAGFAASGHAVTLGTRDVTKPELVELGLPLASFADAATGADVVVLAVNGKAAAGLVADLGDVLAGTVVIDTTNPFQSDEGGHFFWTDGTSLGELVQQANPAARVVKAFNAVGNEQMLAPGTQHETATMFIAGDDTDAKATVTELVGSYGWAVSDAGGIRNAGAVEALGLLWVRHGMTSGTWGHVVTVLH